MTANPHNLALEPAAQAFAEATDQPPYLFQLPPEEGRKAVDGVQDGEVAMPAAEIEVLNVPGGPDGDVETRIVRPAGAEGVLPVLVYLRDHAGAPDAISSDHLQMTALGQKRSWCSKIGWRQTAIRIHRHPE